MEVEVYINDKPEHLNERIVTLNSKESPKALHSSAGVINPAYNASTKLKNNALSATLTLSRSNSHDTNLNNINNTSNNTNNDPNNSNNQQDSNLHKRRNSSTNETTLNNLNTILHNSINPNESNLHKRSHSDNRLPLIKRNNNTNNTHISKSNNDIYPPNHHDNPPPHHNNKSNHSLNSSMENESPINTNSKDSSHTEGDVLSDPTYMRILQNQSSIYKDRIVSVAAEVLFLTH